MGLIRWLFRNLGTLLLAFALAAVVWISAVTAADPNVERERVVPLEIVGLDPNMLVVGNVPTQVRLKLEAPTSVMDSMNSSENAVRAWVDVSGLGPGIYDLQVMTQVNPAYRPVRRSQVSPEIVTLNLESLITRTFPVEVEISGDPAVGYQKGAPRNTPTSVTVSGAESLVTKIERVRATMNIADATETVESKLPVVALDKNNEPVSGVTITPAEVDVTQPIYLQGGYRNVIVKVLTTGQPADGYKLTNITVSPLNVVVFSTDPQLVNDLPGYVETKPIDLTGAEDDVETFVDLNLPEGVLLVGDQTVLVRVGIAAIEGSLRISLPVIPIGLLPTQAAIIAPDTVDVILSGPVPILNNLKPSDIRVIVDVANLELGIYQLQPQVDVLPERIQVQSIQPATVEVTIIPAPTPTPTSVGTPIVHPTSTPKP